MYISVYFGKIFGSTPEERIYRYIIFPASQHRKFNGERVYHQQKITKTRKKKEPVVSQLL